MTAADIDSVVEIDGTIESMRYLHVEKSGEGLSLTWKTQERPLREKLIQPNALDDERLFALKQVAGGVEEGFAVVAEHDGTIVAAALAQIDPAAGAMRLLDLRVDYDFRRQGLATALLFQVINEARNRELRAVSAETSTNNIVAAELLRKCGFELAGLDLQRRSNHDLVKEVVTLFWYAALS